MEWSAQDWVKSASWLAKHEGCIDEDANELCAYLDLLDDAVQQPDAAWSRICEISEIPEAGPVLANLGAGPIEELLVVHGEKFVGKVIDKAKVCTGFREALSRVCGASLGDSVRVKIVRQVPELESLWSKGDRAES